jgi:hypothetical protein
MRHEPRHPSRAMHPQPPVHKRTSPIRPSPNIPRGLMLLMAVGRERRLELPHHRQRQSTDIPNHRRRLVQGAWAPWVPPRAPTSSLASWPTAQAQARRLIRTKRRRPIQSAARIRLPRPEVRLMQQRHKPQAVRTWRRPRRGPRRPASQILRPLVPPMPEARSSHASAPATPRSNGPATGVTIEVCPKR